MSTARRKVTDKRAADARRHKAYRARQALARVAPEAVSVAPGGSPVADYCRAVVSWASITRTPDAGRFASLAAELLDKAEVAPEGSVARALARLLDMTTGSSADDLQRTIAAENLSRAMGELQGGRADARSIRAGLRAGAILTRRRPKFDEGAVNARMGLLLAGGHPGPGGFEAPRADSPCTCGEFPDTHVWGQHFNWDEGPWAGNWTETDLDEPDIDPEEL